MIALTSTIYHKWVNKKRDRKNKLKWHKLLIRRYRKNGGSRIATGNKSQRVKRVRINPVLNLSCI